MAPQTPEVVRLWGEVVEDNVVFSSTMNLLSSAAGNLWLMGLFMPNCLHKEPLVGSLKRGIAISP